VVPAAPHDRVGQQRQDRDVGDGGAHGRIEHRWDRLASAIVASNGHAVKTVQDEMRITQEIVERNVSRPSVYAGLWDGRRHWSPVYGASRQGGVYAVASGFAFVWLKPMLREAP
jgi:hypothetical protein